LKNHLGLFVIDVLVAKNKIPFNIKPFQTHMEPSKPFNEGCIKDLFLDCKDAFKDSST
jgi:hypothetical protein